QPLVVLMLIHIVPPPPPTSPLFPYTTLFRSLHTLYRYHVSETSIQDGKVKVHGEFQKVSTISASLQKRLLENGMPPRLLERIAGDRKSTRLNSSHVSRSYAVFCLKEKNNVSE